MTCVIEWVTVIGMRLSPGWRVLCSAAAVAIFVAGRVVTRAPGLPSRLFREAISSVQRQGRPLPFAAAPNPSQTDYPNEPEREYVRALKIADVPSPGDRKTEESSAPAAASASGSENRLSYPEFGSHAGPSANSSVPGLGRISIPRSARAGGARDILSAAQKDSPAAKTGSGEISAEVASVAAAVKEIKTHEAASAGRQEGPVRRDALMRRLDIDQKVDAGLRRAIGNIERSGRTVTPEALHQAFAGVLRDNGLSAEDVDEETAAARADSPEPPPIAPEALQKAVDEVLAVPPEPAPAAPEIAGEPPTPLLRDAPRETVEPLPEPQPHAPPPRGAMEAYQQNRAVLDRAQKEFGVRPQDILAILYVETRYGRNTGTNAEIPALNGLKTRHALQGENDLAALIREQARGELGGRAPGQLRGSVTGAIGAEQCQPSSCEAYGRSASGGTRDPFNMADAILFVANYLHRSGYSRDVAASIRAYNHSDAYVKSVLQVSDRVAAGLPSPEQR